jgi:hypothetical protein
MTEDTAADQTAEPQITNELTETILLLCILVVAALSLAVLIGAISVFG